MKFTTFCENRYQELVFQIRSTDYDCHLDAETKSVHGLLKFYRGVLKWLYMPKVLFHFLCINLRLKKPPEPVLMNQAANDKKREEERSKQFQSDQPSEEVVSGTQTPWLQ